MGPGTDVLAEIDLPKARPIQLITVQIDVTRITRLGIVFGVGRVPFQDDLVFAVPIHVPHAAIAR
jgi:hypothetical protein